MERVGELTGNGKDKDKRAAGRKDKGNQPAVMDVTKLRDSLTKLKNLKVAADDAASDYGDAVTKAAEKCGVLASVVRKVVSAYAGDDFEEEKRKVEQLALVFEEVAKG